MTSLLISIVNYRTPQLVVECIDSLLSHPPRTAELRVAVVDNASGDGSLELIAECHPQVRLIASLRNRGFGGGNNLLLAGMQNDYVLLLNSDARVEPDTLDELLGVLEANPEVAAVSARVVNMDDGADQDFPERFPSLGEMIRRLLGGPQTPAQGRSAPVELERLHGACMMIRATALADVGLFDEGFFMYDEDVDWCVRARDKGWRLLLVPAARVRHHGGSSSGRAPSGQQQRVAPSETALRMRYELRRSRYRLYRKHRSALELLALKGLTDLVMLASSLRSAPALLSSGSRDAARALLRSNLRILGINPFRIEVGAHER